MSSARVTDISINTGNNLNPKPKFDYNKLINVLDLSDFSNVKLNFTQNCLNNMTNLQHIIVNNLVDNFSDLSLNTMPNIKAIYRDRKDTNITRTVQPQIITKPAPDKSIVYMDIPYNTNVVFPNHKQFDN